MADVLLPLLTIAQGIIEFLLLHFAIFLPGAAIRQDLVVDDDLMQEDHLALSKEPVPP